MEMVRIFDTTLRDGEQSPGATLKLPEKLEIARQLELLGVDIIEAGFPITSPGRLRGRPGDRREITKSTVCGLARCTPKDIERAGEAVKDAAKPRIHVFCATSKIHREHKLRKGKEEIIRISRRVGEAGAAVHAATSSSRPEDASRTELEFLEEICTAVIEAGATTINIPDTVGYATPESYGEIFAYLIEQAADHRRARASSSPRTATTTWAWPSPTRWRPSRTAPARSNARSTASANAPATPRWKRSSWR